MEQPAKFNKFLERQGIRQLRRGNGATQQCAATLTAGGLLEAYQQVLQESRRSDSTTREHRAQQLALKFDALGLELKGSAALWEAKARDIFNQIAVNNEPMYRGVPAEVYLKRRLN